MKHESPRLGFGLAYAMAGAALFLAALLVAESAWAGNCIGSGESVLCGNRASNNTVGRTVVFPTGKAGERQGKFIIVEEDGRRTIKGQVTQSGQSGTPAGARIPGTVTRSLKPNFGHLGFPFTRPE